jgi:hypothetical protein
MSLPSIVRVKVSSETAEMIALSPVVVQEMKMEELVRVIVSSAGKNPARVREVLERGSVVIGASRFRWDRLNLQDEDIAPLLAAFPDPDPRRPFDPLRCDHFILRGGASQIALDKDAAHRKRLFRRRSFWDELLDLAQDATYAGYSYKESADVYRLVLDPERQRRLRAAARLSPFSSTTRQIEAAALDRVEFFVKR